MRRAYLTRAIFGLRTESAFGAAVLRRRTRRLTRGREIWAVTIDAPDWALLDPLADYARALGLTSKWEAVGHDAATMIADVHRLGRERGFAVMAFGDQFTLTFDDQQTHVIRASQ